MFSCNLKYLDTKTLRKLQDKESHYVLMAIVFLSQHTWQDIILQQIKKYHEVPFTAVKKFITKHHLRSEKAEAGGNNKKLISFAYSSSGRLLGFRKYDVFL